MSCTVYQGVTETRGQVLRPFRYNARLGTVVRQDELGVRNMRRLNGRETFETLEIFMIIPSRVFDRSASSNCSDYPPKSAGRRKSIRSCYRSTPYCCRNPYPLITEYRKYPAIYFAYSDVTSNYASTELIRGLEVTRSKLSNTSRKQRATLDESKAPHKTRN